MAFHSRASNLVEGDTNNWDDVFVHDRWTGQTSRVSVTSGGEQGNNNSWTPSISADGRYVAFTSNATNLKPSTGRTGILVHNLQTGETTYVSSAFDGGYENGNNWYPSISADGRYVAFSSDASNLVPGDTNDATDIFLHDRGGGIVLVQDEEHTPLPDAQVFHNQHLVGVTGASGTLVVPDLQAGDHLVARYQVTEVASAKGHHSQDADQNWAYRVYITSLDIPRVGEPAPFTVADPNVDQVLTVTRTNTLIGFNILVSVEWDADAAFLLQLRQGFELASPYLYDASDGQMLFERVSIVDDGLAWNDADYQIRATNRRRPSAYVGVIPHGNQPNRHTYFGRFWGGNIGVPGAWTNYLAYRTIIHEFGHYGLGLLDSYYYYQNFPANTVMLNGACTSVAIKFNATPGTNATLMDYQYNATEFAMRNVPGMWSNACELTHQYQVDGSSDWETILLFYADKQNPARWTLNTPATHGGVVAGPTAIPVAAWVWTEVGNSARTPICNVAPVIQALQGATVVPTATVTLHRSGTGRIIAQGTTDANGRVTILGAGPGDRVHFTGATAAGTV